MWGRRGCGYKVHRRLRKAEDIDGTSWHTAEKKPATHSCRGLLGSGLWGLDGVGGRESGGYGVPMVTAPPQGMMFIFLEMVPV